MDWKSRCYCGEIDKLGQTVQLYGWVDTIRDHGQLLFIHLRDISGVVQVVFDPVKNKKAYEIAAQLRSEYVVDIKGVVAERNDDTKNPNISTGNIEVICDDIQVLSQSKTPPFVVSEKEAADFNVDEDLRLKYRYLDLRRPSMQAKLVKRAQVFKVIRDYLSNERFTEVETPMLTKSTPEGARDYLVPSRSHAHQFYALPQSPQLFKQLLMASGMDRYYQIVKCFRDEDLRPNRQPEFTQLDMEASFIDEAFIFELIESLLGQVFQSQGIALQGPFPKISYDDAMNKYGSDRPDLRLGMEMVEVTNLLKGVNYKIFQSIIGSGGMIKGLNIKDAGDKLSKNILQEEFAKKAIQKMGGKGLTWMKMENGQLQSNIAQFFSEDELNSLIAALDAKDNDVLVFVADVNHRQVNEVLGRFRVFVADYLGRVDNAVFAPCWVLDFPLFEKEGNRLTAIHHPFTQPQGDIAGLDQEGLLNMTSRAYDVVINGEEIGGGSIRVHQKEMQQQLFEAMGLADQDIKEKFGFFMQALDHGFPPHGGIALGVDRLVGMILGTDSIRDVIAFPKNRAAVCPLTEAPSSVSLEQLRDLHIELSKDLE